MGIDGGTTRNSGECFEELSMWWKVQVQKSLALPKM
jgi:hypothetical protein